MEVFGGTETSKETSKNPVGRGRYVRKWVWVCILLLMQIIPEVGSDGDVDFVETTTLSALLICKICETVSRWSQRLQKWDGVVTLQAKSTQCQDITINGSDAYSLRRGQPPPVVVEGSLDALAEGTSRARQCLRWLRIAWRLVTNNNFFLYAPDRGTIGVSLFEARSIKISTFWNGLVIA